MFFRWANGRVQDLLLWSRSASSVRQTWRSNDVSYDLLNKVENGYSIADGRVQMSTVRAKQEIALAVDRPEKI
jgi:hypothetical protein